VSRLLVTGASGLLGANLVLEASAEHEVVAVSHRQRLAAPGVTTRQADLTVQDEARALIAEFAPEGIVHCAAATDIDRCEDEPDLAFRLNRDMAANVAAAAFERRAAFLLVSTDAVFDGEQGDYVEDDDPTPLSVYGRSKLEGERAVAARHPQAIIVRTNIFGWNAQPKYGLAEWFLSRCEAGIRSPGWTDVRSTPILVNDLAGILLRLLASGGPGVYHVGGSSCLSKHEFGRRLAAEFDLDPELIVPASLISAGLRAPRGRNLCLRGARAERDLGLPLPTIAQGIARFRRLRDLGTVDRLHSMLPDRAQSPWSAAQEGIPL